MTAFDVEALDGFMRVLGQKHHRRALVIKLFPHSCESYHLEWIQRGPFEFWCHLDPANRERVMYLAPLIYREATKLRQVSHTSSVYAARRFETFNLAKDWIRDNPIVGWPAWVIEEKRHVDAFAPWVIALRPGGPWLCDKEDADVQP